MTPADIDRVFGRARLRMVTGDHVEVFREASLPGERRRYTKRFLATAAGDFREWTEREWRILARLVGHGVRAVPQVVQFDRGAPDRPALVQTYDAGVTVDHWATLLPLQRDGAHLRNVFEDCAHWWALARHCLLALDAIHALQLVHLDLKADNVCVPLAPADFDPHAAGQTLHARFDDLALIDFAFSLVSGEPLESALPIGRQAEYEYQSPRLLRALDAGRHGDLAPTRELDWRCDLFSLAAMLWRYLPELEDTTLGGWTRARHAKARALVRRLVEAHDAALAAVRPHGELIALASDVLEQPLLRESLQRGWRLTAHEHASAWASPTPVTRIALPVGAPATTAATPVVAATPAQTRARPAAPRIEPGAADPGEADAAALPAAAPLFFGTGDLEPIRVDPTDIEARTALHERTRRRRKRTSAWIGGVAVAAAAAASVAVLAPEWLSLRALDRALALAPGATGRRAPIVPVDSASVPAAGVARPAAPTAPAAPAGGAQERASAEAPPRVAAADGHASAAGQAAPARGAEAPVSVVIAPPSVAAAPARPVAVPRTTIAHDAARPPLQARAPATARRGSAKAVLAQANRSGARLAVSPAARAAHPRVQLAVATATVPRRAGVARTWQDPAAPIPWAVAGRPAPHRGAGATTAGTKPAATLPAALATRAPSPSAPPAATAAIAAAAASRSAREASPMSAPAPMPTPVVAATREVIANPAPVAAARPPEAASAPTPAAPVDLVARANELMAHDVPRLAQQAERTVARVLYAAGRSDDVLDDDSIRANAAAVARPPHDGLAGMTLLPRDGQQLNDAARAEYARHGSTPEALMLQVRAFGANPLDAEIAGNLAFLLLRQRPAQAEAARQLALHALTLRGARNPGGRIEDWATLAIASALSGRERDARNALLVTLALAPSLDRQCKAALDVYALYGERLRGPVEAMLQSAQASARARQSSFCEWPPHWVATSGAR